MMVQYTQIKMNNFPHVILFYCHGESEIQFIEKLLKVYIEAKFEEIFGSGSGYYKFAEENPIIYYCRDIEGRTHVTINGFKTEVKKLTGPTLKNLDLNSDDIIYSIIIIDIHESDEEIEEKRKELLENHFSIINEETKKHGIEISKSTVFTFERGIESCLEDFEEIVGSKSGPKQYKISKWIDYWLGTKEENTSYHEHIKFILTKIKKSNIKELFDLVDQWFESL